MVYIANGTVGHGASSVVGEGAGESGVSVPGLMAAAAWAIGLVIGLLALCTGHDAVAAVALVVAIMSPWFGLALVSRTQRRVSGSRDAAPFPSEWRGLKVAAR